MRFSLRIPIILREVQVSGPLGSVAVDLLLDTGSAVTALPWSELKLIGYDPAAVPERQRLVTANGIIGVPKLRVKQILIGDIKVNDVEVTCHDIPGLTGVSGLLGLNFLRHFKVTLDFRQNFMEIV